MVLGVTVSILSVIVAAIASMIVGSLWYGPWFGKRWTQLMGWSKKDMDKAKKQGMGKTYFIAFLTSLVTAYILGVFLMLSGADTIWQGAMVAFWLWLGFYATSNASAVLWEGKPMELYWIHSLCSLVTMIVMAMIITYW